MDRIMRAAGGPLRGSITVPGDKSISHRAVMLSALAEGTTRITGFLYGADCLSTIACFRQRGIPIELSQSETEVTVHGRGMHGLRCPEGILDCGNSGTTTRLLSGILAAQPFRTVLTGDASIRRRPMKRIITPLSEMGARIRSLADNGCAPLEITGAALHGIRYVSPVASAQVKSAILFAGLYADGPTTVIEPALSRDHSERMLTAMGAAVHTCISGTAESGKDGEAGSAEITIEPAEELHAFPGMLTVPGDISSAAYFLTAALLVPGSDILVRNVGINPTRDGILEVYRRMGADILEEEVREAGGERSADLRVKYGALHGTEIGGAMIPRLIDELPVIAAAAAAAEGDTVIRDAAELKVKESNRIRVMVDGLRALGITAEETDDGIVIHGQGQGLRLRSAGIDTHQDHRIAMTFAVLALAGGADTEVLLRDAECIRISYPDFFRDLAGLAG